MVGWGLCIDIRIVIIILDEDSLWIIVLFGLGRERKIGTGNAYKKYM